jgi:glycosyltransferase involved in cell wall biosynthesis
VSRPLRIAVIGARGVPATFGGIEHHVEEIGARMAARGHRVTVFARTNYVDGPERTFRGMRVIALPTVPTKHLDAIAHSGLSTLRAMGGFDVLHYHAIGPGIPAALPRIASRAKVVLTVHGRDGERAKWGRGAAAVLSGAEWLSARMPDATVVVSEDLARHYRDAYGREAVYIPNGVEPQVAPAADAIATRWGLTEGSYLLFVGRLVPEKAPDALLAAFRRIETDTRLVLAGGTSFTDTFVARLEREAARDPRVLMPGYVYGDTLRELYGNAAAFVLPSLLEGLPLTLLEAASYGTPVVASDIPPHLEVLRDEARGRRLFPSGDADALAAAIERSLADPAAERLGAAELRSDVLARYDWDDVTDRTIGLYRALLGARR